jgi:hypothetical protein
MQRRNMENRIESIKAAVMPMIEQAEGALAKVLTKDQRIRVRQISLQRLGPLAFTRPDVQNQLNMSPEQIEQVGAILAQADEMRTNLAQERRNQAQQKINVLLAQAKREYDSRGGKPVSRTGDPSRALSPEERKARSDTVRGAMRKAMDNPEVKAAYASIRADADRLEAQSMREIIKLITKKQRAVFQHMLGEPFDRPGSPAGDAPSKTATTPATPASRSSQAPK